MTIARYCIYILPIVKKIFMYKFLFTFSILLISLQNYGQKFTISGYVSDSASSEKLIGVSVYHPATGEGTITNNFGFYSLTLDKKTETTLVFDYIDYMLTTKKIKLTKAVQLNIDLQQTVSLGEVEIIAEKQKRIENETQMSVAEISVSQIKKIPALLGEVDVLKALQLLPGVKTGGEGQSGIYVRGGGADQNLIQLDGVPVYNASHLFGFFSVFNSDAIKDVKLIKGGFPARYGGRLSSVVDINMKEGNMKKFGGSVNIGLISSKLMLEGPIFKEKTSFMISARRTYIDVLAKPLIQQQFRENEQEGGTGYYFYDLNFKVNHKFSNRDRLYFSIYNGTDKFYVNTKDKATENQDFNTTSLSWGNFTNALRWNHIVNNKLFVNTTLTLSDYKLKTDFDFGTNNIDNKKNKEQIALNYLSGINDIGAKIDFDYVPNPSHFIKFGANIINHTFKPGKFFFYQENTRDNYLFKDTVGQQNIKSMEYSAYAEDDWNITSKLKINAGLHLSLFNVDGKTYSSLQPRVSARYLLPSSWSLKTSFATMRQYINLLAFEGIGLPTDLWVPSTARIKPQDAWQGAVGLAKSIGDKYELSIEGYYKKMKNLVAYKDGAGVFQTDDWQNRVVQGSGDAYGAEVFLQKKEGRLSGWVGYTLSWANRSFPDIKNGETFPYRFDRRHDISIVGSYEISKKVNISGTWVYGTGNAVTLPTSKYRVVDGVNNFNQEFQVYDQRNNYRLAPYHRMDIGINFVKQKKYGKRTFSFGAYNAYSNKNPFYIYVDTKNENENIPNSQYKPKKVLTQISLFPIIPYVSWGYDF
jgi:hypothetical protein